MLALVVYSGWTKLSMELIAKTKADSQVAGTFCTCWRDNIPAGGSNLYTSFVKRNQQSTRAVNEATLLGILPSLELTQLCVNGCYPIQCFVPSHTSDSHAVICKRLIGLISLITWAPLSVDWQCRWLPIPVVQNAPLCLPLSILIDEASSERWLVAWHVWP